MKGFPKRVILRGDPPRQREEHVDCLLRRGATMKTCTTQRPRRTCREMRCYRSSPRATAWASWDATPWFCFENECPLVVGHTKDNNHVTSDYALQLPDLFRDGFRRALSD